MAELQVIPSYVFEPTDIVTVDKLNLLGTPTVTLSLETPVSDENYLRNGNYYSSYWATPAGLSCPVGVETANADYWTVNPNGAALTCKRSSDVPDLYSLWSLEIDGAASATDCSLGQTIQGDLSATLRRPCTFSGWIENNSATLLSPTLEIWTANAFNNFNAVTKQDTVNLQTVQVGHWAYVSATIDLSASGFANVANGLLIKVRLPSGALSQTSYRINFSRLKFQLGEVATGFVDDVSLFVTSPSVDSTMLQNGCIARPSLFLPNVVPGSALQEGSIQSGDIGVGQVEAINLDPGINTTTAANFTAPAVNANVNITLSSAAQISAGLVLNIAGAGSYSVISVAGAVVTAQNTGASGNAAPGTVINSGAAVTTTGNAVTGCLGYTPVNKAGDSGIGILEHDVDTLVAATAPQSSAVYINGSSADASNDTYFPAIGFNRPGVIGRSIGLETTGRFKTVDTTDKIGYLLDTITGVDTASYQAGSITLQALAQSLVNLLIPPGEVRGFAGPNLPAGWLACDGTHYLQSQYPNLFAAIGGYWGSGGTGASAWFAVPDLRGRSILGYVNSPVGGITTRAFATLGGEENHTLSVAELASHAHSDSGHTHSDSGHTHGVGVSAQTIAASGTSGAVWVGGNTQTGAGYAAIQPSSANIQPNGGNGAHNNMQPFSVLFYMIKT